MIDTYEFGECSEVPVPGDSLKIYSVVLNDKPTPHLSN